MRMDGRRESSNVDDRRGTGSGSGVKRAGGLGLGGILLGVVIYFATGDSTVLKNQAGQAIQNATTTTQTSTSNSQTSASEEKLAKFARQVLAGTEDVWTTEFKKYNKTYKVPGMVLYRDAVSTACGKGSSSTGPFYCPGDQKLYIDLSFFDEMEHQMRAGGDFAYAYVIGHEVGHHVQYLLGINDQVNQMMNRSSSEAEANKWSVRQELQADFLAGYWAKRDNEQFNSLEDGDLEEAINCAQKIGDDYLQKQAGYRDVKSDLFTHGTSAQRMRWFKAGFNSTDLNDMNLLFTTDYNKL